MVIDAKRFSLNLDGDPFEGRFKLRTPLSDPDLDGQVRGKINLGKLAQAYPIEGIDELKGLIETDLTAKAKMSTIDAGQYDQVQMKGYVVVDDFVYDDATYPPILINDSHVDLSPSALTIERFDALLGKSDVQAKGVIKNVLAYFSPEKTMTGNLTVTSKLFDANEWYVEEETTEEVQPTAVSASPTPSEPYEVFDQFDFKLNATIGEIIYDTYQLTGNYVDGRITANELAVRELRGNIQGSDFKANGQINQLFDYLFKDGVLQGDINLFSNKMDLNPFMVTTETTSTDDQAVHEEPLTIEAILVPPNITMNMAASIGTLLYNNIELNNLTGHLDIDDRTVILEDIKGKGLGGELAMAGEYNTQDRTKPAFNIKYDLNNLDFQQTFNSVNTFQKLAPIGKFINGNFTTSLIMDGIIGSDFMPILDAINAKGYLETLNGVVQGFKPLEVIGNTLDIKEFQGKVPLAKTKNWFEIEDGMVRLEPFDYQWDDINLNIKGSHSISQNIDYTIVAKVPREKLNSSGLGAKANEGISLIQDNIKKLGINVNEAEYFNIQLNLTGSLTDPTIKTKFLGAGGNGAATTVKDAATEAAKEQVEAVKETVVDSVKTVAQQKVDEIAEDVKEEVTTQIKDKVGAAVDSTIVGALDSTQQEKVDDIKDALKQFNPFKKKKKNN